MTLNIPFLLAHILVQHLFEMEEKYETSVVCDLRASLSTLPVHTEAKCSIFVLLAPKGGFTPNGLTLVQTLFTRY
ncbi:hypothetical protein SERLA73DRAFT_118593 [Serpula lacrymans var. lacrymans S7.3]|uniref:Uncharacterized protein n=2 Tax=Serpula lacrymans var. lacrymans TaxID=341189 RepID=F8PEX5_SERL3|nr:uncharacterized protein SERLADRAFT_364501 [Serpula lacrymans var. lacrymans S7.9]EGO04648.1 hypothetical protein SERLA73DRAFT_118593 [Serpula lacrymans var. lacrymans S7.3]EGO30507.1 hypothetical protein SERLADRAFT_364501 [Serpula lacrymans var. lacrymans S7.9]